MRETLHHKLSRLFQRRLRQLPFFPRLLLLLAFVLSAITYAYIGYYAFVKNHTAEKSYLEVDKCPFCYGQSLCKDLANGEATLKGYSRLQFLNSLANVKNVHFGEYRGHPVVFKKLAHQAELAEFDAKYAHHESFPGVSRSKNVRVSEVKGVSDMMTCPSERLIDVMLLKYKEKVDAVDVRYPEKLQLLTTLKINPEPIILQTFPKEAGWPFPHYYGACGRFVVVENIGASLSTYYHSPWTERFTLYFSDVTYDNFAVDDTGKIYIVDAENIIVVDKWQIERDKKPEWDTPDYSSFDTCENYGNCLTLYPERLCSRFTSDFNYYAVCRDLLSSYASDYRLPGGLLHDTPATVNARYGLDHLLNECAKPETPGGRLKVKDKLLKTLEEISKQGAT